jgi:hypothetical protein
MTFPEHELKLLITLIQAGIKDGILVPFVRESIGLNLPLKRRIKQPQVKTSTSVD